MLLAIICTVSYGDLYIFTDAGYVARSIDDGVTWSWLSTKLPVSNCVDMTADPSHNLVVISRTGELYRSANQGMVWESRGNISVSDACAVWAITGLTFALTESGDFYQRFASGSWSLLGNVGASDCVELVPKPNNGWLVFTRSGDVWEITTDPFSTALISNIGSSSIRAGTSLTASVLVVTEQGDVARSVNNGATWSWQGSVSQLYIAGITNKSTQIYLVTHCGEIARSTDQGVSWTWQGNVNQIGTSGITSDTLVLIGVQEHAGITMIDMQGLYPNPSRGRFTVKFRADGYGAGVMRLFDIAGRDLGLLWQGDISPGSNTATIRSAIKGINFIVLMSDGATARAKAIVR
jgi:hypothetical protein